MSRSSSTDNLDVASLVEDINLRRVAQRTLVVLFLGFFLVPPGTGIIAAIKTNESVARSLPFAPPVGEGFALGNIQFALEQFSGSFFSSLIMSVPATIESVLFGSMAAYGLTMVDWWAQIGMLILFVVSIFVPYQAVLIPLARFWNNILPLARMIEPMVASIPFFQGYHTELIPLVITHAAYGIPICTILFRSYCQNPPNSLVEAGKIDGVSIAKIYRHIVLPISRPMFGVVFIYQFAQIYSEFFFVFTLVTGSDAPAAPATLVLPATGVSTFDINFGIGMSTAFLTAAPTLTLCVVLAEQFAEGLRTEV